MLSFISQRHNIFRHILLDTALFFLCAIVMIFLANYGFALGDQIIHLPYIKKLLDPGLFAGDTLLSYLDGKPTLFWKLLLPFLSYTGLEWGFLFLQLISAVLLFFSVKLFVKEVTGSETAAYIAAIANIIPHYSFGYSSFFVPSNFIPRNLTIPLVILIAVIYLKHKKNLAYFLLGLIGSLHIISALPMFVTFLTTDGAIFFEESIREKFKIRLKNFISYIAVFLAGLTPLLVSKAYAFFQKNSLSLDTDFTIFYKSILHPFYIINSREEWIILLNAVFIIAISLIWLNNSFRDRPHLKLFLLNLLMVSSFLVFFSYLSENFLNNSFLVQLQLGRSGKYTVLVFLAFISSKIVNLKHTTKDKLLYALQVITLFLSPILAPLYLMVEIPHSLKDKKIIALYLYAATIFILFINKSTIQNLPKYYGISVYVQNSATSQTQEWIRNNTPKTAKILAPFYIGGYTEPDFRVTSERTNVLTNADIVETILNVNMLVSVKDRLNDVTMNNYDTLVQQKKLFDYYAVRELYHQAVESRFEYLTKKYSIDYVVIESDYNLNGKKKIYENSRYKIYKTTP